MSFSRLPLRPDLPHAKPLGYCGSCGRPFYTWDGWASYKRGDHKCSRIVGKELS